jgi:2-polyprenyl-6-methoxyphenol hydroxylase-like FAD-dependent oxidoreductase
MRVAICGCGIGGLAAAIFGQRSGFDVTLFDQFEVPEPIGSGLTIQPVGLAILAQLGAAKTALAKGAKGFQMLGYEAANGRVVLDVSYGERGGEFFGLGIHRSSLFEAMLEVARAEGVAITAQHRVVSTEANDQGRFVHFANGASVGPFDLVIDTSGANSAISPLVSKALPYGAIWGTVDWPEECLLPYDRLQQRYCRASSMVGVMPIGTLPNETTLKAALFWSLRRDQIDSWQATPIEQWRDQATALWPELKPFTDQISAHSQMTPAVYSHGSLSKPYGDRIVFIGDAAHRASPQLGQGANMALLDAAALMQCLNLYPLEQALPNYMKSRRRHVNIYQALSWAFTPMYQSDSRLLPVLRDYILAPLSRMPPAQAMLRSLVKGTLVKSIRGLPPL